MQHQPTGRRYDAVLRTALAVIVLAVVLVCAQSAGARGFKHRREGARMTFIHHYAAARATTVTASAAGDMATGMGDVYSLGCQSLPNGGTVVRVIVDYYSPPARWYACAAAAVKAGHRLELTVQYANIWPLAQDQAWFRSVLALYGPLHPWSVGIGNEQELREADGGGMYLRTTAQQAAMYVQVWKAVEPIVASMTPGAVRDAGEISPWGYQFMQDAVSDGLPGAQALSAHPYPASSTAVDPVKFAALAHSHGLAAWATEGMCGPGAWMQYGCRSAASLQAAGMQLGIEWWVPGLQSTPVPGANGVAAPTSPVSSVPFSSEPVVF